LTLPSRLASRSFRLSSRNSETDRRSISGAELRVCAVSRPTSDAVFVSCVVDLSPDAPPWPPIPAFDVPNSEARFAAVPTAPPALEPPPVLDVFDSVFETTTGLGSRISLTLSLSSQRH
jgi:hypothetical protein